MDIEQWQSLFEENYDFLIDASIALIITALAAVVWRIALRQVLKFSDRTKTKIDDYIVDAIKKPSTIAIWALGFSWLLSISATYFDNSYLNNIQASRQIALLVILAWAIWRLINNLENHQLNKGKDPTTVQLIGKIARLVIGILIALPAFQMMGVSLSGLLAFGGMGGLIVGMAAKDLLANFFGSLVIYLDRPFKVGNWIRSPDRNIEGTVEHIGFRVTRIRTFDKRPLYVPNSVFTTIAVENPSRMLNRRIKETIGIRYEDSRKMPAIINDVKAMLKGHPDIDTKQTLIVNFNSFGASSLDFFIYTFTKTTDWVKYHEIKQDVMLQVLNIIHQHEADCAFPTQTLHIDSMPEGMMNQGH